VPLPLCLESNREGHFPPLFVQFSCRKEVGKTSPSPVCVEKRWGGKPSRFTATSRQKPNKGEKNTGAPLRPLSSSCHDHVVVGCRGQLLHLQLSWSAVQQRRPCWQLLWQLLLPLLLSYWRAKVRSGEVELVKFTSSTYM
jgi:hypothetical protein